MSFIGQDALRALRGQPLTKRLLQFTLDDPDGILWGGELILLNGEPVGKIDSGSYGHTLGCSVGLGYVSHSDGVDKAMIEAGGFEIDIGGVRFPATPHLRAPYDPTAARVRA